MVSSSWLAAVVVVALGSLASALPGEDIEGLEQAESLLTEGKTEEVYAWVQELLVDRPEDAALLDLASRCALAMESRDEAMWYAQLALDHAEDRKDLTATLNERLATLDPLRAEGNEIGAEYDDFVADLFSVAMGCARSRLYVNAAELFLRCRGTRFEARAEKELDKLYSNKKSATALFQYGMDLPSKPMSAQAARQLAARDAAHSSWENRYERKTTNYTVETNMGYEMLEKISNAMEQMNKRYRRVFNFKGRTTRCTIRVYKSREEFDQYEGRKPRGVRGFYVPSQNRVSTYDPRADQRPLTALWSTLFHEASHQFTKEISKGLVPGWLNEGTASYFEGAKLMPNGTVVTNGIPEGRLENLAMMLRRGSPHVLDVVSYYSPGSYQGAYYPFGWGLAYFMQNYEDEECERPYIKYYNDYLRSYRKGERHNVVERFEEFFVKKPKREGIETFDDFAEFWKKWMLDLNDHYFLEEGADHWIETARKRLEFGKKEEALEAYRYALRLRPDDIVALLEIADLQRTLKQTDPAALNIRKALAIARRMPPDEDIMSMQRSAADVVEECLARLEKLDRNLAVGLRRAVGGFAETSTQAATMYADQGFPRAALRVLDDAVNLLGGDRELEQLRRELAETSGVEVRRWRRLPVNEELEGWKYTSGWRARDGRLSKTDTSLTPMVRSGTMPRSFRFSARVSAGDVPFVGLAFGRDAAHMYGFFFGDIRRATLKDSESGPGLESETLDGGNRTQDVELAVEIRGDQATFFVDGEVVGEHTYGGGELVGEIGVYGGDGCVITDLRALY